MQPIVKIAAYVLSCGVVAGALSMIVPQPVDAAPGASSVRIVNAASEPVPVAGTVDARVSGSVALADGTSVTIGGPVALAPGTSVTIGNAAGNPIPVREIGDGRQPLQGSMATGTGSIPSACSFSNGICVVDMYTVPAGHRLVVEQVSVNITLLSGRQMVYAAVGAGLHGPGNVYLDAYDFIVPQQLMGDQQYRVYQANHQTLMFFEADQIVRLQLKTDVQDNPGGVANVRFAGYLVPLD